MNNKDLAYYLALPYVMLIRPGPSPEDGYLAEIPLLEGCFTFGDTAQEALNMLEDAKRAWLSHRLDKGYPIPEPEVLAPV